MIGQEEDRTAEEFCRAGASSSGGKGTWVWSGSAGWAEDAAAEPFECRERGWHHAAGHGAAAPWPFSRLDFRLWATWSTELASGLQLARPRYRCATPFNQVRVAFNSTVGLKSRGTFPFRSRAGHPRTQRGSSTCSQGSGSLTPGQGSLAHRRGTSSPTSPIGSLPAQPDQGVIAAAQAAPTSAAE